MQDLIDFIRSYREPVPLSEAASELHALGNAGAGWARASELHWTRELERMVADGLLEMRDGRLSVPRVGQGMLF